MDGGLGGIDLERADVFGAVDDLPLEVGLVDNVEVDQAELADAGGGEVEPEGRAEAAGADKEDARGLEFFLAFHADFREDEVPAVAGDFVLGKLRGFGGHVEVGVVEDRAAGDGGHEHDLVAVLAAGRGHGVAADVVVVEIDVDEVADIAVVVEEMTLEFRVLGDECVHHLTDRGAGYLDRVEVARVLPECCRK